LVPTKSCVT